MANYFLLFWAPLLGPEVALAYWHLRRAEEGGLLPGEDLGVTLENILGAAKVGMILDVLAAHGLIVIARERGREGAAITLPPEMPPLPGELVRKLPPALAELFQDIIRDVPGIRPETNVVPVSPAQFVTAMAPVPKPRNYSADYRVICRHLSNRTAVPVTQLQSELVRKSLEEYDFSRGFLLAFFDLTMEKGMDFRKVRVQARMLEEMRQAGIDTQDGLEEYLARQEKSVRNFRRICEYLGRSTRLSEPEEMTYIKWSRDWEFSQEVILKACEVACLRAVNPGFEYIDTIMTDWHEQGLHTLEQVEEFLVNRKANRRRAATKPAGAGPIGGPASAAAQPAPSGVQNYEPLGVSRRRKEQGSRYRPMEIVISDD